MIKTHDGRFTRRHAFGFLAAAAAALSGCGRDSSAQSSTPAPSASGPEAGPTSSDAAGPPGARAQSGEQVTGGDEAWQALLDGNARFADGTGRHPRTGPDRRETLVEEQHPIACVLSCADSRVPPEIVFDQGLGDLFTIRSAGEVLDEAVIGSIEYAVVHLGVPLLVVLGHSGCGAVQATVDVVRGDGRAEGDIAALVQAVEPAVRSVSAELDDDEFLAAGVDEQARRVAAALPARSAAIRTAVEQGTTRINAAVYDLGTGRVNSL